MSFNTEGVNRGNLIDTFVYTGSRSNRYFVVRFFRVKPGRKNVTSALRLGYNVPSVVANGKVAIVMEINPKGRGKTRGAAKKFNGFVLLKSGSLRSLQDRVKARLIVQ